MKTTLLKSLTCILIMTTAAVAHGQYPAEDSHNMMIGVPSVAILDIETAGSSQTQLKAKSPSEAGHQLNFSDNNQMPDIWINYSAVKSSSKNPSRDISVSVTNGALPAGVNIKVEASSYSGNGDGDLGTPTGQLQLSPAAQPIISGIGSCYTGDGINNGHSIQYSLDLSSANGAYASLSAPNLKPVQVTYTISDD